MVKDIILQNCSPTVAAQALEANKIAFGTLLSKLPRARLNDEPGLLWFETGIAHTVFNGVLQTQLEPEVLPTAVECVLAHFQQKQFPFHWTIGPYSRPFNLGILLEAHGIRHDEDEPGMAADLLSLNEDLPVVPGLVIQPVINEKLMRQWSRTTYCGAPEEIIQHMHTAYSGLPYGPQSSLRLYVGTFNDEPVATVALFFGAGVAYIGRVVTIHAFRRQGIGAMMTLHAAREARSVGYRIAVLTASPMGINIYRRLGFQECCVISTYEWSPTSSS